MGLNKAVFLELGVVLQLVQWNLRRFNTRIQSDLITSRVNALSNN